MESPPNEKGTGKGKGKSGPPPKAKAKATVAKPPSWQETLAQRQVPDDGLVEGAMVLITAGINKGLGGKIVKVQGIGQERRFRVELLKAAKHMWEGAVKLATEEELAFAGGLADLSSEDRTKVLRKKELQHFLALPPADINAFSWEALKRLTRLDGGSGGVTLLDLGDSVVCTKRCGTTSAHELMAEQAAMCCDVRVARSRVIRRAEPEKRQMMTALVDYVNAVGLNNEVQVRVHSKGGKAILGEESRWALADIVLEFVPGFTMQGQEAGQVLAAAPASLLQDLGRLCAFDALINNLDRVPLPIWQNEGNLGNVMISTGHDHIVGIDQQVNPIRAGSFRDSYIQKVQSLLEALATDGDISLIVKRLEMVLEANCGVKLENEQADIILQGIRDGFAVIKARFEDGSLQKALEEGAAVCIDRLKDDGMNPGLVVTSNGDSPYLKQAEVREIKSFVEAMATVIASADLGV
jgi:hypothetical protein